MSALGPIVLVLGLLALGVAFIFGCLLLQQERDEAADWDESEELHPIGVVTANGLHTLHLTAAEAERLEREVAELMSWRLAHATQREARA